jgi:hypothetical protein
MTAISRLFGRGEVVLTMAVRLKSGGLGAQKLDKWYVTDGLNAVGPLRLDLLARGIELGRVPTDSFVRNESWKVWRPLSDFTEGQPEGGTGSHAETLQSFADEDLAHSASVETEEFHSSDLLEEASSEERAELDAPAPAHSVLAVTLPSDGVATVSSPPRFQGLSTQLPETELVTVNQDSADLLGAQRLTLASLIDDEETNVATQRPFGPPIVLDAPKPLPSPSRTPPARSQRPLTSPPGAQSSAPTNQPSPSAVPRPRIESSVPRPSGMRGVSDFPASSDAAEASRGSLRPAPIGEFSAPGWTPELELAPAKDLADGLLLLLHSIVQRTPADIALVHRMSDEGATVVCAHGPNAPELLGSRVRLLDPAVVAAAGGSIVIAEPAPGPAGDATIARLSKLGRQVEGAVMIPLRPRGRLLGLLEMGKAERFHLRSIIRAEDLARAFVAKAEANGWIS